MYRELDGVFWTTSSVSLCWLSSLVIFMMQTVQGGCLVSGTWPYSSSDNHTLHGRLRIIKITHHGKLQLLLRVIAASSDPSLTPIHKFPSPPYVPAALNLIYVSDKSVICMKVCHNNMFICHPLHYIHISSYRQLPSANCCNILIQIVLFVIYIWVRHYNSTVLATRNSTGRVPKLPGVEILYNTKWFIITSFTWP